MIRVLIVDDSPTARLALGNAFRGQVGVRVVAEASNGASALAAVREDSPDVVLMDVYLGDENGLDVTAEIMSTDAKRIIVVTGINPTDPDLAFRAIEAGALEVCAKLHSPDHPSYESERRRLLRMVVALSKVPVVTRRAQRRRADRSSSQGAAQSTAGAARIEEMSAGAARELIVIGGSTGAPPVLLELLEGLPAPFPMPIVIGQHLADGFAHGFASWLGARSGHRVTVCDEASRLQPGTVYIAADASHLELLSPTRVGFRPGGVASHYVPSIDRLFESAAKHLGAGCVAVLLSGMGRDGARGMAALRKAGALCVAQQPKTCVIGSMPSAAIDSGSAQLVLTPGELTGWLANGL